MGRIQLSGKNFHLYVLVDDNDMPLVSQYKWYLQGRGYAYRNRKYKNNIRDVGEIAMHRMILGLTDPTIHVDHINGNKLDNRRENLRICTIQENNLKRGIRKDNTSGAKGVHFNKKTGKWMARISIGNKRYYLGLFTLKEEAIKAYNKACKKYHGKFAQLNFVK